MSNNSWKQRQRQAKQQPPPEKVPKFPFKSMLRYSFQIFAQKYLIILVPFLIFAAIMVVVKLIILPEVFWQFNNIYDFYYHILYKMLLDPSYVPTAAEYQVLAMANQYKTFYEILLAILDAIPQYFGILTTVIIIKRSYEQISQSKRIQPLGALLVESFTSPFRGGNAAGALISTLLISLLVPLGLAFLLVPGFMALIYMMFSLQVAALEKNSTVNVLRGGFNHVRKKLTKTLGIVLLGFIITYVWGLLRGITLDVLLVPPEPSAYNPATRDLVMIFFYFLGNNIWMALIYPLIACLYTMLYLQIKTEKPEILTKSDSPELSEAEDSNIRARRTQQVRYCPHCGRTIPVTLKVCNHCNQPVRRV